MPDRSVHASCWMHAMRDLVNANTDYSADYLRKMVPPFARWWQ